MFRVPFTFASPEKLKKKTAWLASYVPHKKNTTLQAQLENLDTGLTREQYLAIILRSSALTFVIILVAATTLFALLSVRRFMLLGLALAFLCTIFISLIQRVYPKHYALRKQKAIEKNLIPALEDMLVQLNSGIPLFSILINISNSDYGELSNEFKKMVKKINTGRPQIDVLDEAGKRNTSPYFRRTLWQLSNGMKAGSDISIVIKDSIKSLNEEQLLQIQTYGNKLNPLVMFYMLISVILPALAITFLTVISSMVSLPRTITISLFTGVFVLVVLIQITFLGVMKSLRPSLL